MQIRASIIPPPLTLTLFTYTTLFRSQDATTPRSTKNRAAFACDVASWRRVTRFTEVSPPKTRMPRDRKSTRLNSSHQIISYAVFCLKKKIHGDEQNGLNGNGDGCISE